VEAEFQPSAVVVSATPDPALEAFRWSVAALDRVVAVELANPDPALVATLDPAVVADSANLGRDAAEPKSAAKLRVATGLAAQSPLEVSAIPGQADREVSANPDRVRLEVWEARDQDERRDEWGRHRALRCNTK